MSKLIRIPANSTKNIFEARVSKGDIVTYEIDFTAWEEDNNTITSVTWLTESGGIGISNIVLNNGITTALLDFTDCCDGLVSVVVDTGTEKKKIWFRIRSEDHDNFSSDYSYE